MSQRLTKLTLSTLTAIIALAFVSLNSTANAQSRSTAPEGNQLEQSARASWQPVRDLSRTAAKRRAEPTQIRLVDHQETIRNKTTTDRPTPAPRPSGNQSVPVRPASAKVISHPVAHSHVPLDGQVILDPIHDGSCDAMPMGCGDGGCDDGCSIGYGGCDGVGCSSGSCCNGDPLCGEYQDCDTLRPCVTLCWPQDGWFSAEYLMWWQDGMNVPPLASTGRLSGRDPLANGTVLFGGEDLVDGRLDGYRFDFGFWLNNQHTWGIGAGFFGLNRETDSFSAGGEVNPLVRPIFTVLPDPDPLSLDDLSAAVSLINFNDLNGSLAIDVDSQLSGWDLYLRHFTKGDSGCTCMGACCCPTKWCSRSEHRLGFRQVTLDEGIRIDSFHQLDAATSFTLDESFRTSNQFNGIDVGWFHTRSIDYWNFDIGLRLAAGNTRQRVRIDGSTVLTQDPAIGPSPVTRQGGLLALDSNIGNYERDEFSVIPELNLRVGYQLTDQLRATFGYTFLYWSNVVRPGDQIERIIDQDQIPNANAPNGEGIFPRFAFDNTDYWAQGLSFGMDYRW